MFIILHDIYEIYSVREGARHGGKRPVMGHGARPSGPLCREPGESVCVVYTEKIYWYQNKRKTS